MEEWPVKAKRHCSFRTKSTRKKKAALWLQADGVGMKVVERISSCKKLGATASLEVRKVMEIRWWTFSLSMSSAR